MRGPTLTKFICFSFIFTLTKLTVEPRNLFVLSTQHHTEPLERNNRALQCVCCIVEPNRFIVACRHQQVVCAVKVQGINFGGLHEPIIISSDTRTKNLGLILKITAFSKLLWYGFGGKKISRKPVTFVLMVWRFNGIVWVCRLFSENGDESPDITSSICNWNRLGSDVIGLLSKPPELHKSWLNYVKRLGL